MEQLTKQQIVLVTLLVSFVTSIATGIVTVALMDQAPPGVTQTINRVVERTIEKVVPAPNQQTAAVVTKETIVVKEDDLVVKAVEQNSKSVVSIIYALGTGETKTEEFVGNGLVVDKDGLIATDASIIRGPVLDGADIPVSQTFKAVFSDGTFHPVTVVRSDAASGIVLLRPSITDKTKPFTFYAAKLGDESSLKLGQTIIALGGEKVSVATGIVSNLSERSSVSKVAEISSTTPDSGASKASHRLIKTDIYGVGKTLGAIIANLSGDVVGIRTISAGIADNVFLPASLVTSAIAKDAVSTPNTVKTE